MSFPKIKLYFKNFGCKTNFADLFSILGKIKNYVDFEEGELQDSDFVILNSCSVTEDAEKELAKYVRRAKKYGKKVLVSGCLSNLDPNRVLSLGADFVIGAGNYSQENISKIMNRVLGEKKGLSGNPRENEGEGKYYDAGNDFKETAENGENIVFNLKRIDEFLSIEDDVEFFSPELFPRHRIYLKIQEGCSRFCSFCSIPLTRGLPRFLDKSKVVESIRRYYDLGIKEVVLVGTHLALYGQIGKSNLSDLTFGKLVKEIAKVFFRFSDFRIRFASLSPGEIDDDFLEGISIGGKIFCPHFHISVQSGSNKVLKLMKRWHTFEDFLLDSQKLLNIFKHACIGTDIIVGFPGETDEDFKITLDNLKDCSVGHIHVFPFSPRPKTPAYFMKKLSNDEIRERVKELMKLARTKRKDFIEKCSGQVFSALIEENINDGFFTGTTENYIQVIFRAEKNYKLGDLVKVKVVGLSDRVNSKNLLASCEVLLH